MKRLLLTFALLLLSAPLGAQDQVTDFPPDVAAWFLNRDGSCVQCSISMCGVWQNVPAASTLLWDTEYGPRVRGGSYPSRVESYCDARKIPVYNVTGEATIDWIKWASKTGRMSAIGCYSNHFQTCLYYNPDPNDLKPWKVKNNWGVSGGDNIRSYNAFTDAQFRKNHLASGRWVVILKAPPPPPLPRYVAWWN